VLESKDTAIFFGQATDIHIISNAYFSGGWKYKTTNPAADFYQHLGVYYWRTAPSGTQDNTVNWTTAMQLDNGGNLTVFGGVVQNNSDVNSKENFSPVDGQDILTHLADVPITTWNFKTDDPDIRHIGPMAQDFYAAFDVGMDERHIAPLDTNGVALAAIQELHRMVQEKDDQIAQLQEQNTELEARLEALEQIVASLVQQ
jgi:hypothetical protein